MLIVMIKVLSIHTHFHQTDSLADLPNFSPTNFLSFTVWYLIFSYKYNDRKVLLQNVKTVDKTQAELHILKVDNWMHYKTPFLQIWSNIGHHI